jgi:hypothetical protein
MSKNVAEPDWTNNWGTAADWQVPAESDYIHPTW